MNMNSSQVWFGSEASFLGYLRNLQHFSEHPEQFDGRIQLLQQEMDEDVSLAEHLAMKMSSNYGSTRVINVEGPMHPTADFFDLIFAGTSYESIATALSLAVEDDEIDNIVLALDTPGGSAQGVFTLADTISEVGKVKPVTAYASGGALSAGYILATAANEFRADRMAEIGSVGAVSTITSISRKLKEEGIDVEVIRAGEFKALSHPAEPISEKAKQDLQEKTNYLHSEFLSHVLHHRPSLGAVPMAEWGEGQVMFTPKAIEKGLVDGPAVSFGSLLDVMQQDQRYSRNSSRRTLSSEAEMPIVLSESARAALASGAALEELPHAEVEDEVQEEAALSAEAQQPDVPSEDQETEEPEAAIEAAASSGSELTTYLQSEIKTRDSRIETLLVELASEKAQVKTLSAVEEQLKPIAIAACKRMSVALGGAAGKLDGLSTSALVDRYNELETEFNARFKVGQSAQTETEHSQSQRAVDPSVARLQLVQGS